jgi:lipopolysaccharide export system permease protein
MLLQGALIHFAEPLSMRAAAIQLRAINADLIARASVAGVFTEIEPGVTLRVDRRISAGEMEGFFLHDDRNPEFSQTILASQASVARTADGIDVSLSNGSIAFRDRATGNVSTVNFVRYGLGAADIIETGGEPGGAQFRTTPQLMASLAADPGDARAIATLHLRISLPLYAATLAALCFFTLGFPGNAALKRRVPVEIWLLTFAIIVQGVGVAIAETAYRDSAFVPLLYAVPLLPLLPAAWLTFRRFGRGPRIRLPLKATAS